VPAVSNASPLIALKNSFFLSPQLYDELLHAVGELDR